MNAVVKNQDGPHPDEESRPARVLIVGAGAMGMITAYILTAGGARTDFLVRPGRRERLSRPQILYSYDDNSLKSFSAYEIVTDPSDLPRDTYDFVVITIGGMELRSDEGQQLVRSIGAMAKGTRTKVLIGTMGVNLRPGFLALSGLAEDQVFNGGLYIAVFQADRLSPRLHPPVDAALLGRADFAYRQATPIGMFIDSSAPEAARRFAQLFEAAGVARCMVMAPDDYATQVPAAFPVFAACTIMGWPDWTKLQSDPGLWDLTARAVREIQGLGINGEAGKRAQALTTPESLIGIVRQMQEETLPLDWLDFNRFHHGGKMLPQDIALLEDCVALGQAEGEAMAALRELIARTEAAVGDAALPTSV